MIDDVLACAYRCVHFVAYCKVCHDQVLSTLYEILAVVICSRNLIF